TDPDDENDFPADFDFGADADGDGFPDWYENAVGSDPNDGFSTPSLGDVTGDETVSVADALRALQIIRNNVMQIDPSDDLNAINVTGGEVNSLINPYQILLFQAGVRTLLPALEGFDVVI